MSEIRESFESQSRLDEFIEWYIQAYRRLNVNEEMIGRNVSVIRDAFNSCHAGFYIEKAHQ